MSANQGMLPQQLIVVVHGVGKQLRLETLRQFIEGATSHFEIPGTFTKAELAERMRSDGMVVVPGINYGFQEYNYADKLGHHPNIIEQNPSAWIKSIRNRLREINRRRNGPPDLSFSQVEYAIDDILIATMLARLVAVRFHIETKSLQFSAAAFLQQVELYIDHAQYREEISQDFHKILDTLALCADGSKRTIKIVAHSLGTVVALRCLIEAAKERRAWIDSVGGFVTFGSPIDLLMLLYPNLFDGVHDCRKYQICWTNYSLKNDPIASDLAIARNFVATECVGLFTDNAPEEVDLGAGSMASAHIDYWQMDSMLREVCSIDRSNSGDEIEKTVTDEVEATTGLLTRVLIKLLSRCGKTIFQRIELAVALAVAWLLVVWWEENLKVGDSDRVVLINNPLGQLSFWIIGWLMVISHVKSRCAVALWNRMCWRLACFGFAFVLVCFLPGMPLLGELFKQFRAQHILSRDSYWELGNLIVFLVPLSLFVTTPKRRLSKTVVIVSLLCLTVFLSFFVGTRDNPSNASEEFGLLGLAFGLWWLCILLERIHQVFIWIVGGRHHLEVLSEHWKVERRLRDFRRL